MSDIVKLIGPDGVEGEYPAAAKAALLGAGFTEPAPPAPEPKSVVAPVALKGPDGTVLDVSSMPDAAIAGLLAAGYTPVAAEPSDADEVTIDIQGTKASMPYAQAKALIATGTAKLVGLTGDTDSPPANAPEPEPLAPLPGDADLVPVTIVGVPAPIPMAFAAARAVVDAGGGAFGDELTKLISAHKAEEHAGEIRDESRAGGVEVPAAASQAAAGDPYDKALTVGPDAEGKFSHPAIEGGAKKYATKGAVTQALNKLAGSGPSASPATPAAATPPAEGRDAVLAEAKVLLADGFMEDFEALMKIFGEVAGKRNIQEFTEPELIALNERLKAEIAKRGA